MSIVNCQLSIEVLSHIGFFFAIGLAAWFHYLRNTFGDSAMILFNLINEPNFWASSTWLSVNWFQNAMTILAVKSNFSLPLVSMVFSASPMMFAYIVFLITFYGFKRNFSGIFLLLLLLGINFSFFGAVNSIYIAIVSWYAVIVLFSFIFTKKGKSFNVWSETIFASIIAIGLQIAFVNQRAADRLPCLDMAVDELYFSLTDYFFGQAINTYVIVGCFVGFLCLMWAVRKDYYRLLSFLLLILVLLGFLIFLLLKKFQKEDIFIFDYEFLFLPLVALVLMAMNEFVWERFPINKRQFGILAILVFLAIGGQLRNLSMFEKRQSDTIRLLTASNSLSAEKIAISNRFQRTE
ncbi:MAG: hypothetical protein LBP96_02605, partial [Bacteroidales bacterium]|nr:hypothetical protein [Bacteroidales bacterium]